LVGEKYFNHNNYYKEEYYLIFMKHLFVIRPGSYDYDNLTDRGKEQIETIAEEMKAIVGENFNGHYLISSTAPRAEQTAEIIAKAFGLETFNRDKRLWTSGGNDLRPEALKAIDEMIEPHKDGHDIVTISSHCEVTYSYPRHILSNVLKKGGRIREPRKGEGVHFDLEAKTYQMIPKKSN